jgi:DNA-binding transcriptional LysR family regulator
MNTLDFPWDDLRYLEALERTGKVGAAARELGISVSTFYRRAGELEALTGQLCIKRMPTGATLTEFGSALAHVGKRTRGGLQEVLAQLRAKETTIEGEVSVTTVVAFLPLLSEALVKLNRDHPRLQVTLHLGDDGPSVRQREVDVAVGVMKRPPQGCWGRKLLQMPAGIFATREAAARTPRPWVLRSLAEVSSPESAWERTHAGEATVRASFHAMVDLCASGLGLCLMPKLLAARHPALVEVREFSHLMAPLERTVWLLTHPDQRKTPRVVAVTNALAQAFSSAPSHR